MSTRSTHMSARDKLILGTIDLVQRRGVAASGLADILERSSVSRRSVYLNFPEGKPQLVAEATVVAGGWIAEQIRAHSSGDDALDALAQFVEQWKSLLTSSNFNAGCPVVAAALAREVAPGAADAAAASFIEWNRILGDAFVRHGVAPTRSPSLARTVVAAVEGAVVMGVAMRSIDPLNDVETNLADLIAVATLDNSPKC